MILKLLGTFQELKAVIASCWSIPLLKSDRLKVNVIIIIFIVF